MRARRALLLLSVLGIAIALPLVRSPGARAARSYSLATIGYPDPTGTALGYQLCSTDACQVYRGLGIAQGPYGNRWVAAVNATRTQVLLSGGRPADAVYFSTSNGHTVGNE